MYEKTILKYAFGAHHGATLNLCLNGYRLKGTGQDILAGKYYYDAVLWAAENGITSGTSDTTFSPDNDCSRAQIVTFLYRYFVK